MKGKIIKSIMTVLLVCCISVPMSGCAFVNPDVRDNFEGWFDDFLGGVFGDAGDNDEDNENEGNQNGNGGNSSETETEMFIGNGVILYDCVNDIMIRPEKTTVTVGESFTVNVFDYDGDAIDYDLSFAVYKNPGSVDVISVDKSGNVTALSTGEGVLGIQVGDIQSYYVKVSVVAETTSNETYVLSAKYQFKDCTITVSHHEVVMKKGESFTVQATTTETQTPIVTVEGVGLTAYDCISIDGLTVKAEKTGTVALIVRVGEGNPPFYISVTIIE